MVQNIRLQVNLDQKINDSTRKQLRPYVQQSAMRIDDDPKTIHDRRDSRHLFKVGG